MQEKMRTIHVYFEEEEIETEPTTTIDADPPQKQPSPLLGSFCVMVLVILCMGSVAFQTRAHLVFQNAYDTTIYRVVRLDLSLHPNASQIPLLALPEITEHQQMSIAATGSIHQDARTATGLITFYNGVFTAQIVPAGTTLRGKDGIEVKTEQDAHVPAATPTTPPTYGTVSVTASALVAGEQGNIPASDVDSAYGQLLAQNLYAFSGGQDAQDRALLTKDDLSLAKQTITSQVAQNVSAQIQKETPPGAILLDQSCHQTVTANHQAGDQVKSAVISMVETCSPLAYFGADVATKAQKAIAIPGGYHTTFFSAIILSVQGRSMVVSAIVYLKMDTIQSRGFRFGNK